MRFSSARQNSFVETTDDESRVTRSHRNDSSYHPTTVESESDSTPGRLLHTNGIRSCLLAGGGGIVHTRRLREFDGRVLIWPGRIRELSSGESNNTRLSLNENRRRHHPTGHVLQTSNRGAVNCSPLRARH